MDKLLKIIDCECGTFLGIIIEKGFMVENIIIPLDKIEYIDATCGDCGKPIQDLIIKVIAND